jgi:F-type H+-transporting ATPase subunit delta
MRAGRAVAKSYARALYDLARDRRQIDEVARDLAAAVAQLRAEPSLRELFARPWVGAAAKGAVAVEVATRLGLTPLVRDFLGLVARHGRAADLDAIAAAFGQLADEAAGRVRARVRTAVSLTEDERATLRQRLGRVFGGKQIVLEEDVDERLLGGFVAEVDSVIVDGSLDGQLARLRDRLARA